MSAFGMGIVAGVTQVAVQSQQVSRSQHRQHTDAATDARRLRERLEDHLQALEEGDDANLSQLRVGDREGDGQSHPESQKQQQHRRLPAPAEAAPLAQAAAPGKTAAQGGTLYHHVDITA